MRLKRARIQNFRSIVDSGNVDIESRLTVIIGKNEQGKTTFLRGLASIDTRYTYAPNDLPNHLTAQLSDRPKGEIPIVTEWLSLDEGDRKQLEPILKPTGKTTEICITKYFDGHYSYIGSNESGGEEPLIFEKPNIIQDQARITQISHALKVKLASHASRLPPFAASKPQVDSLIDNFVNANFSDLSQIDNLLQTFVTALNALPGHDQAVQNDLATAGKDLKAVVESIKVILNQDPKTLFVQKIPTFFFHSTSVDKIPNEVNLTTFVSNPDRISKGMANLCRTAGLSTQKILELSNVAEANRREVYEDSYKANISGGINEFWTQEHYQVHFRIEKEKLSVSISDSTYPRRIPPSDRSEGFQW